MITSSNVATKTVTINAPPAAVWRELTVPERMKQWMAEDEIEIITDWVVGKPMIIRGELHGIPFENRGSVQQFEVDRLLQYTHLSSISKLPERPESYSVFEFQLAPIEGGTALTLRLSNFPTEAIYKHLLFYWNVTLELLKKRMETEIPPFPKKFTPHKGESMFITHADAKIYTTSFGSPTAPTILGIGGWIGSWELWAEPFSFLSRQWRIIAYDHRGSGATVAPVESITADQLVDDLFAVMDACNVEQCVLAAESAGAVTALSAALAKPDRITGLAIVDGLFYRPPADPDMFLTGLQKAYPTTLERFVEACVPEANSAHIKRWGRQIIGRAEQAAAIALYNAAGSVDLRQDLPRIQQPTLIIHGEADAIVPLAAARILADALPNAKLITLPDAGHVPTLTRPNEIAQLIADFFETSQPQ